MIYNLVFYLLYRSYLFLFVVLVEEKLLLVSLFWFVAGAIKHCPVQAHLNLWGTLFDFYVDSCLFKFFILHLLFLNLIFLLTKLLSGLIRNFDLTFMMSYWILCRRIFHLFILQKAAQFFYLMLPWELLIIWLLSSRNFVNTWISRRFFLTGINNINKIFIFI